MDTATITRTLKLVTYNIHSYVGRDGRCDTSRIQRILDEEQPDIAALRKSNGNSIARMHSRLWDRTVRPARRQWGRLDSLRSVRCVSSTARSTI